MDNDAFRQWSVRAAEWGAAYRETLRDRPVRPMVEPGAVFASIEASPPETAEPMEQIFADFEAKIVPGMTHWQHPSFFAYFPANAAPVSVVAEYLVSAMAAQCMLWQTSPAATELETRVIDWMRQALGLPAAFSGVIQDSASSATLAAVLTMRERALDWQGNRQGLAGQPRPRVYASDQVHTSIDRAIWVSGIGEDNLVRIPVAGDRRAMDVAALEAAIVADREAGMLPAGIVACVGGTSTGATDDIAAVAEVARRHGLYLHVDAAWAGSAMICPEYRHFWTGIEQADSIVFNPHKWLGAQFDCSIQFLRDPESHVRTLAIKPGISEDAWPRRRHQLFRMVDTARKAVSRPETVVPAASAWPRRPAYDDPQPCRLERGLGRATGRERRFRDRDAADAVAVFVPASAGGRRGQGRA